MPEKLPREIVVPGDARRTGIAAPVRRRRSEGPDPSGLARIATALEDAAGRLIQLSLARPLESAGTLAALGVAGYIAVNALGLQEGRHPAPILPQPKPVAAREPRPVARHAPIEATRTDASAGGPRQHGSSAETGSAQLTALVEETTASVTPKADKSILQAQRALARLGYGPLKDDGLAGPDTRAAIEKFERDHKLPVTGAAAGRTLRELAARSARTR